MRRNHQARSQARARRIRRRRIGRTAVLAALAVLASVLSTNATPASAAEPMFSCPTDGSIHATAQEQQDFAQRWADRLMGQDPAFNLQSWLDDAVAGAAIPPNIATEVGFVAPSGQDPGSSDTATRGCLTSVLADEMKVRDATFGMDTSQTPPVPLPDVTVKSMLAMVVFHNKPAAPAPTIDHAPDINLPSNPVTAALHQLGLDHLLSLSVPKVALPGIPAPISKLIGDLVKAVQGLGLPTLPDLTKLIQLPALPLKLPNLLTLPSITDLINLVRSIIDSTTYTVCYKGPKTNGQTKCTSSLLAVPVLIDVQGDASPDLRASLAPTVVPQYPLGLSMTFTVDRIDLLHPLATPPRVPADVSVAWDLPVAQARADLGFLSTFKAGLSLAQHSELTATVTNLNDATQGNPNIPFTIKQTAPDTESQVVAGFSKLIRNPQSGATTAPESTTATLDFTPVPTTVTGSLNIQTTSAGANKTRYIAKVNPSSQTTLLMNLLRNGTAAAPSPCCPIQSFTALVDKLPNLTLDILKDSALNQWTVGYTGDVPIGHLGLQGDDYPTAADFNAPSTSKTVSSFSADVTQLPTKVDVVATLPKDGANPRTVDVQYAGSSITDPTAIVKVPSVDLSTLDRVNGDVQRSFHGTAKDVPGRMHVLTTLSGDALNTPAGPNLDVDMTYDSSSSATNLTVDFFDKGAKATSKLTGTIATLPPWLNVKVGNHPSSHTVLFNAKANKDAADGSDKLGKANVSFAKNAEFLNLGSAAPTTDQYAVVKSTNGADGTAGNDDDSTSLEAQYQGLKLADVALGDDGQPKGNLDLHAKVLNDSAHALTARFDDPQSTVDAVVDKVPTSVEVTYARRRTGTNDPQCNEPENTHKVVYDAQGTIDHVSVAVQNKKNGAPDPNSLVAVSAGRDPVTNNGPIPAHMEVFSNGHSKSVSYRASSAVGQVAATLLNASPTCGGRSGLNVDLRGVPTSFGAALDTEHMRFADLANATDPIDQVLLDPTKPVSPALGSASIAFTDHPSGAVPQLPTTNQISVVSDKRSGGGTEANIRLAGIQRFGLDLLHESSSDPTKVTHVLTDLQLASALDNVGTSLDFIGADNREARVTGPILHLTPSLHLDLDLAEGASRIRYDTGSDHLGLNLEIGLGDVNHIDDVDLGTNRPVGFQMRDSDLAKKIGVYLVGAPTTLDVQIDRLTVPERTTSDPTFLKFGNYQGSPTLSVDVQLTHTSDPATHQRTPSKDLIVTAILHDVPAGYSIEMKALATGADTDSEDVTKFDALLYGNLPLGKVELTVLAGVPKLKNQNDPPPGCSACNLTLSGTLSNLPPGFEIGFLSEPNASHHDKKDMLIELQQFDGNKVLDPNQSITSLGLTVLLWERSGTTVRTDPQIQVGAGEIPAHVIIKTTAQGDVDSLPTAIAQLCGSTPHRLPTLSYEAGGNTRDALDLNLHIDFTIASDDPAHPDEDAAVLDVGATNLSHSILFQNDSDGTYHISHPDPAAAATASLHLEVGRQTMPLLNWSFKPEDCGFGLRVGPVGIGTLGGVKFNLRAAIVLDATNLSTVNLKAGLFTSIDGTYGTFTFGLRNPQLVDYSISGFGVGLTVYITDSIHPTIGLVIPPFSFGNSLSPPIPLGVDFLDIGYSGSPDADWINLPLLVPCDVDVSWDGVDVTMYHAHVTTHPGWGNSTTDGFSVSNNDPATFFVSPYLGEVIAAVLNFIVNPIIAFLAFGGFGAHIGCPN